MDDLPLNCTELLADGQSGKAPSTGSVTSTPEGEFQFSAGSMLSGGT